VIDPLEKIQHEEGFADFKTGAKPTCLMEYFISEQLFLPHYYILIFSIFLIHEPKYYNQLILIY